MKCDLCGYDHGGIRCPECGLCGYDSIDALLEGLERGDGLPITEGEDQE